MNNRFFQIRRSVALVSLAAALVAGGALAWAISSSNHTVFGAGSPVTLRIAGSVPAAGAANFNEGFSAVVEPLLPAVVNISTSKVVKSSSQRGGGDNPFFNDPFFRQFFGSPFGGDDQPREQKEHSLGSGVIVNPDGYILTNNHVVDGASDVQVTLSDKRQLKAKIIGTDPRTDIAVLKIQASSLATVTLGDSTKAKVGDIVLAIGDPFGIGETVTMGIVSAKGRRDLRLEGPEGYEDFIQTDASINPGNSGGALVNTRGELIGINTAIISNGGGGNQGIGFAVPVNMARTVMEQILKTGKVVRGYLGVSIQEVTPDLAKAFNLPSAEGALVGDVQPDSPGAKAGLQKGDVITALNGQRVSDYHDLRLRISQLAPGTAVKLEVYRSGQKQDMTATLGEFPEKTQTAQNGAPESEGQALEGVQVENLTNDIAQQLNLPAGTRGVVITRVDPDSTAADTGLQRGDVIQEVNRKPVNNVEQFRAAVRSAANQPLLLLLNRGGSTSYVVISPK
ncbi:MAG TPA: DegQ family serine endoprotease [Candidatus Acidoferrales bacterium]|jgi:serine protease Do|nr:DegQ family serine endoprotease [Candidatus Acidoferrales bacterium]